MQPTPLTRKQAREVDRHAIQDLGFPGIVLMENAGIGCVEVLSQAGMDGPVLVIAGGGNNGGDGFVIARHLLLAGHDCRIALASDPSRLTSDAQIAHRMMLPCHVPTLALYGKPTEEIPQRLSDFASDATWIADALLGTGTQGNPRAPYDAIIRWMNAQPAKRLAVDLPSGLDCDTGAPGYPTVHADHTCTFVAPKIGFQSLAAYPYLGKVHVVGLGIPT